MEILCLNVQLKKTSLSIQPHTIGEIVALIVLVVPNGLLKKQVKETLKNSEMLFPFLVDVWHLK